MAEDDKETSVLPARVERALAAARRASRREASSASVGKRKDGRWLALVPAVVCLLLFLLMVPRAAAPDVVPLPDVDERVLATAARADAARAARARSERLPGDVLAVGSAFREIQAADARGLDEDAVLHARTTLAAAVEVLRRQPDHLAMLPSLRALQLEGFLAEVARFEASGEVTAELEELGGAFLTRMGDAGWLDGRRVLLTDAQRRAAYKTVWNAIVGEVTPELALALDEQRALYALYLTRPHPPEARRGELEAERRAATTEAACERAARSARRAAELWRVEKIKRLGAIDPSYPTMYALGVAYFHADQHDLSLEAFRRWIDAHPDGPWSLRARNHLKAAVEATGAF